MLAIKEYIQNRMIDKKLVFISGLHRSGTSILHKVISHSDDVSGFYNTGVTKNEGQHLQTVYEPAQNFGGPGKFAFTPLARLDENSSLVNPENRHKLIKEWGQYWNNEKRILIEKSPPNLIRQRFLQALFPEAYFITIIRHPIPVSLATKKWSNTSENSLIRHWIEAHRIFQADKTAIKNELFFSYESMVRFPYETIKVIEKFLDIRINYKAEFTDKNTSYFKIWQQRGWKEFFNRMNRYNITKKYEKKVNEFGYSLVDFEQFPKMSLLSNHIVN